MFKKLPLGLLLAFGTLATYGQTIVSTSPENKNVVLEEFTGIHCVYCPSGHAIAKSIKDAHPDDVYLINIHTGGYATPGAGEPDFRTPYGAAIAGQSGLTGYPSGTVNRHNFPGLEMGAPGTTAMGRGQWATAANQTLGASSVVNVGVTATIDVPTREATIHVEVYYTGNSPESTNLLNVALLQNNTLGPQTGGGMGNNYVHQHRLVDLITGQWGEDITTTTSGSFIDRTYTYTIPAMYNNVEAVLDDMEVVAFVTNTHQELPSGFGSRPMYTGISIANDASLRSIEPIADSCGDMVAPVINLKNQGQNTITSLEITYTVNGTAHTYNWSGNIPALWDEDIELPAVNFNMQATNTVEVTIPADDNGANNTIITTFDQAPQATGTVYLELHTDGFGSECRWNVKDSGGNIIYFGGPYGNNQTINETLNLSADCYSFSIIDTFGDGGGAVTLTDSDGTQIYHTNGNYGSGESSAFSSNGVLGVGSNELSNISLYPNPATSTINLKNAENANIQVYDVLGKLILSQNNISAAQEINVSKLQTGTYFMKIEKDNFVTTKRFIISN